MGQRLFPHPSAEEANGGWLVAYPFLQHVQSLLVDDEDEGHASLETIEAVLVAAQTALSKAVETGTQADNSVSLPLCFGKYVLDCEHKISRCASPGQCGHKERQA
jgi:hypothetical protein